MTPAKLYYLDRKRFDWLGVLESPVALLACMYANSKLDPGDEKTGRPAATPLPPDNFRVFKRGKQKGSTLAAKVGVAGIDGWDHRLQGAKADRTAWEAFGNKGTKKQK